MDIWIVIFWLLFLSAFSKSFNLLEYNEKSLDSKRIVDLFCVFARDLHAELQEIQQYFLFV